MAHDDEEFSFESLQDRESIVRYLAAVSEGFASGRLLLGTTQRQLALEPQGLIRFDVEGRRKEGHIKLKLRFSWKEEPAPAAPSEGPFIIKGDAR